MGKLIKCRVKKSFKFYAQGAIIQMSEEEFEKCRAQGAVEEIKNKKAQGAGSK
ncbi:MAG: hypothetical protein NTW04_04515 [Elusimicrobia bacterium]|nr:hypothetical protein [Elusimicrobiota bacterium]